MRIVMPAHFIIGAEGGLSLHHAMAARMNSAPASVVADAGHFSRTEQPGDIQHIRLPWLLKQEQ